MHNDRRSAHRRVGAATILAFLALLLLGATRGPAEDAPTLPVPAATAAPSERQPANPGYPGPDFDHDRDGHPDGHRGGDGPGFGRGGAAPAPAPSPDTGGSQT